VQNNIDKTIEDLETTRRDIGLIIDSLDSISYDYDELKEENEILNEMNDFTSTEAIKLNLRVIIETIAQSGNNTLQEELFKEIEFWQNHNRLPKYKDTKLKV
jgi:hypothetical protein